MLTLVKHGETVLAVIILLGVINLLCCHLVELQLRLDTGYLSCLEQMYGFA